MIHSRPLRRVFAGLIPVCLSILMIFPATGEFENGPIRYPITTTPMNTPIAPILRINEAYPNPSEDINGDGSVDQDDEFIEIFNAGESPLNLSGYILDDEEDTFSIGDITIESGGYAIFIRSDTSIVLGRDEKVILIDPSSVVVDTLEFSSASKGDSFQRSPDGSERIRRTSSPTPDSTNIPPPDLVINEILLDPPGANTGNQWIEILNLGEAENLEDFRLNNDDGFDVNLPEFHLERGERVILSTGNDDIPDPHPQDVVNLCLGENSALYLNGDNLELTDPEGYSVDFFAWGSSTHVDPPLGKFPGDWKGRTWDGDNETMSDGLKNPAVSEGRSLIRHPDGIDTDSPIDWTTSHEDLGGSPGWNNSVNPCLDILPDSTDITLNRSESKIVEFEIDNRGNISGYVEIRTFLSSSDWKITGSPFNPIWLFKNESYSFSLVIESPPDLSNHQCDLRITATWSEMDFINWSTVTEMVIPGPDLYVYEAGLEGDISTEGHTPEGILLSLSGKISGGGELGCDEAILRMELSSSEGVVVEELEVVFEELLPTSKRSFDFEIDTLGRDGEYTLNLSIDPEDLLDETDESNNNWTTHFRVIPSIIVEGASKLVFSSIIWNTTQDGVIAVIENPTSSSVDISGFKVSDGSGFASFPDGTHLDGKTEVAVCWGGIAEKRAGNVSDIYHMDYGRSGSRLNSYKEKPDPFSSGEIHLLDKYRKTIDSVKLKNNTKEVRGFTILGGEFIESTWSSPIIRKRDLTGVPVDTNTSLDWDCNTASVIISSILIRPGGLPGEYISLSTGETPGDVSGYTIVCGNRICTIPNGTISSADLPIIISREPEDYREIIGDYPLLTTSYDKEIDGGVLVRGCRVPSFSELLLPDDGGSLTLLDPGSRPVESVEWGEGTDIGRPERNTVIGKDGPDDVWKVLGPGNERIWGLTDEMENTEANLTFFGSEEEALNWTVGRGDLKIHADRLRSNEVVELLSNLSGSGTDVEITYLSEPWRDVEEWNGGSEKRSWDIWSAGKLLEEGVKIYHFDHEEAPSLTMALGGLRVSISIPLPGNKTGDPWLIFGIEFRSSETARQYYFSLLPGEGDKTSSETVISNMEIEESEIIDFDPGIIRGIPLPGKLPVLVDIRSGIGVLDIPGTGPLNVFVEGGPFDLLSVVDVINNGGEVNLSISPTALRPLRCGNGSFIDSIKNRMDEGSHLLSLKQMEEDLFARSVALSSMGIPEDELRLSISEPCRTSGRGFNIYFRNGGFAISPSVGSRFMKRSMISLDLRNFEIPFPLEGLLNSRMELPCSMAGLERCGYKGDPPKIRIEEIYYDTYMSGDNDESVALYNFGEKPVDLAGFTLSDDEGSGHYMDGTLMIGRNSVIQPEERFYLTLDGGLFHHQNGFRADASLYNGSTSGEYLLCSGFMRLANTNDTICLRDRSGKILDSVPYGSAFWRDEYWVSYPGGKWKGESVPDIGWGRILKRTTEDLKNAPLDTNSASDWRSFRPYYPGQSSHPLENWTSVEGGRIGICPQSSSQPLESIISNAREELLVNVYEITSDWITSALLGARQRGVRVRVLVEGAPVGGISMMERGCLDRLVRGGIEVRKMDDIPSADIRDRYRFDHAKYVIRDLREFFVSSDNFKDSSFPPKGEYPLSGTRGWVVSILSPDLCRSMKGVFLEDWNGMDSVPWEKSDESNLFEGFTMTEEGPGVTFRALSGMNLTREDRAIPLLCPDHISILGNPLLDSIASAKEEILVELMDMDPDFSLRGHNTSHCPVDRNGGFGFHDIEISNPYLVSLFRAAQRGVNVSILLDGSDFDGDGCQDNMWVANFINSHAKEFRLEENLKARVHPVIRRSYLADTSMIHNKGAVIDSRYCWISSFNWGPVSGLENREVGVLLDSRTASGRFREAFLYDWGSTLSGEVGLTQIGNSLKISDDNRITMKAQFSYNSDLEGDYYVWLVSRDGAFSYEWDRSGPDSEGVEIISGDGDFVINWTGNCSSNEFALMISDGGRTYPALWFPGNEHVENDKQVWDYPWYREPYLPIVIIFLGAISISLLMHTGFGGRKGVENGMSMEE